MSSNPIQPALFKFLRQLKKNNDREWFAANKARFEADVKQPLLAFVESMEKPLKKITRHVEVGPRCVFRIYRDTRFSKDKSPYKTNAGVHFRHVDAKCPHSPGFYLHLEPNGVFVGQGIWHPDSPALLEIRKAVVEKATQWKRITRSKAFRDQFKLVGESLKRPPKGFDADHPLVDDLKRKDFITMTELSEADVCDNGFPSKFTALCRKANPFVKFLAEAVEMEW